MRSTITCFSENKKCKQALGLPKLWSGVILIVLSIIFSSFCLAKIEAAPVVIIGDGYGSWEDNFDDTTGIEIWDNLTWTGDYITLNYTLNPPVKNQGNPIINNGGGGWKDVRVGGSCVIWDDNEYKMWFYGYNIPGTPDSHMCIGYANSANGYEWSEYPSNPVIVNGTPGSWDELHNLDPCVVKHGGLYHLWYTGYDDTTLPYQIGYANSADGITWTKHPTPVLTPSLTGWDNKHVAFCGVIFDEGLFKMWYSGHDGSTFRIGYATSSNGIDWDKYSQNPVMDLGSGAEWDSSRIARPTVLKSGGIYRMWYTGRKGGNYGIGYAFSVDGISWNKYSENPILVPGPEPWDNSEVNSPSALQLNEEDYFLYYDGKGSELQIGLANLTLPQLYGSLTSTEIVLPNGQTWESVVINKSESGVYNSIDVSILNGSSYQPIPGFENLIGTEIDISSIDHEKYPTIRLQAHFFCNGTDAPILHGWKVTWLDTIPPATPKGLTVNNPFTGYSLILSWYSNTEPDLVSYVLYYSTDNSTFYLLIATTANTISYIHYGLAAGTTYYYKIAAADEVSNQSPFSEVVNGTPDQDMDGNGVGDLEDPDIDGDTVLNEEDAFPMNEDEWADTDGDGIGNNADLDDDNDTYEDVNDDFPLDETEWNDLDEDSIGDNADEDMDGDGVPNDSDEFPVNAGEWKDSDGDDIGDNADLDDDNDDHPDINDDYPYDSSKWLKPTESDFPYDEFVLFMYIFLILLVILIIIGMMTMVAMVRSQKRLAIQSPEQSLPQPPKKDDGKPGLHKFPPPPPR